MRFKIKTNENLDWNNPNILNYQYIDYLKNMVHERYIKAGIIPVAPLSIYVDSEYSNTPIWNDGLFQPHGILSFRNLQMIYSAMIFLGLHCYINESKLKNTNWKYGDNIVYLGYSLTDMCELAGFDFFANPFIPGQPIKYYEKFLGPMYKVLSEYKKLWLTRFRFNRDKEIYYTSKTPALPKTTVTINGEQQTVDINRN